MFSFAALLAELNHQIVAFGKPSLQGEVRAYFLSRMAEDAFCGVRLGMEVDMLGPAPKVAIQLALKTMQTMTHLIQRATSPNFLLP